MINTKREFYVFSNLRTMGMHKKSIRNVRLVSSFYIIPIKMYFWTYSRLSPQTCQDSQRWSCPEPSHLPNNQTWITQMSVHGDHKQVFSHKFNLWASSDEAFCGTVLWKPRMEQVAPISRSSVYHHPVDSVVHSAALWQETARTCCWRTAILLTSTCRCWLYLPLCGNGIHISICWHLLMQDLPTAGTPPAK